MGFYYPYPFVQDNTCPEVVFWYLGQVVWVGEDQSFISEENEVHIWIPYIKYMISTD